MDATRLRPRALRRRGTAAWLCCLALVLPLGAAAAAPPQAFIDYLYIEASSGSSAGGHTGVRFGERVYHFQHDAPGIISAAVQSWASFDLDYRGLDNRPIHVQQIAVPLAAYERLLGAFEQRYVVEQTHLARLESARRDAEFLHCLADGRLAGRGDCGVKLDGAGYFFAPPADAAAAAANPAVDDLRREIERVYGADALALRRRHLRAQIERLRPHAPTSESLEGCAQRLPCRPLPDGSLGRICERNLTRGQRLPATKCLEEGRVAMRSSPGFADAYADLLLEWLALGVIAGDATPLPAAFRKCPGKLTASERAALAARLAHQRSVSLELLTSPRADRGYPLLISLARQAALRLSRETGELFVLDTYADGGPQLPSGALTDRSAVIMQVRRERQAALREARAAALAAPAADELLWSRFEVLANVALELDAALAGRALRRHQPDLSPSRGAVLRRDWPAPRLQSEKTTAAVNRAARRQAQLTRRLRELYRYDLVRRNCVTEIFRTFDSAAGTSGALGTRIPMRTTASFIPFVSAVAVRESYRVVDELTLPSYRQQALRRLLASSDSWLTRLREETSLTSTLVPFDAKNEAFLFFSTDTVVLRPLVGLANLVFGAAAAMVGVIAAPVDGATLLQAGARGVFYSAPELAFVNIRKGTVPLLPSNWASPADLRLPRTAATGGGAR